MSLNIRKIKVPAQGRNKDYKYKYGSISVSGTSGTSGSSGGSSKSWLESYISFDSENEYLDFSKDIKVPNLYITGQVNHWLEDVVTVDDASLQLNAKQDGAMVESGLIIFDRDNSSELSKLYYDTDNFWKIDGNKIATREDSPLSNGIAYWDAANSMFKTRSRAFDSDKLDGLDSGQFLRSDTDDTTTGRLSIYGGVFLFEGSSRINFGTISNRFLIAPRLADDSGWDYSAEFGYRQSTNAWYCDTNFGIGTEAPSEKLHVNGNSLVTGIGKFGSGLQNSGTFVSGFAGSGWKLDGSESHLTVDKLTVRKEMNIYELIINKIRSSNGAFAVSDAFECGAYLKYGTNPITYKIYKKEGDSRAFPFVGGDFVKAQEFDSPNVKYFTGRVYNVTNDILYVRLISGEPWSNMTLFRYDSEENDRKGFIYLTSSDEYSPYLDVVEGDGTGVGNVPKNIRYIRDWLNGSTSNEGNHTVEIQAIDKYGVNKALGKDIINNGNTYSGTVITDGDTNSSNYYGFGSGLRNIIVDLGEVTEIETIKVWHYYADGRTYHNTKTEVSADGETWYTVFDSAIQGEYKETSAGRTYSLGAQKTRLRLGKLPGISGQSGYGIWGSRDGSSTDFVISSDGYAQIAGINFNNSRLWTDYWNINSDGSFEFGGADGVAYSGSQVNIGSNVLIDGADLSVNSLPVVSDEGLMALYRLDEGSGNRAIDSKGNYTVDLGGSPVWEDGISQKGITNSQLYVPNLSNANFPDNYTLSFWVKSNDWSKNFPIFDNWANDRNHFFIRCTGDHLQCAFQTPDGYISHTYLEIGGTNWNHIAVSYDIDTGILKWWFNGEFVHSSTIGAILPDGQLFKFGKNYSKDVSIDEVRLYNRALTDREIKSLYLNPSGNSGGLISANQVKTGELLSENWDGVNGTRIDLNNGLLEMGYNGQTIFKFDAENKAAKIAGINFNDSRLWTANWELKADGTATFTKGKIGGFNIDQYSIYSDDITINSDNITLKNTGIIKFEHLGERKGRLNINNSVGAIEIQTDLNYSIRLNSDDTIYLRNKWDSKIELDFNGIYMNGGYNDDRIVLNGRVETQSLVFKPYISKSISSSSTSPTTINTHNYTSALVCNRNTPGYISLTDGVDGQIFVVVAVDDSRSVYVGNVIPNSGGYYKLDGGSVLVLMWVSNLYNSNTSGWFRVSAIDNNW